MLAEVVKLWSLLIRRQTRLTALDLIAFLAAEDNPKQWLHMPEPEMERVCSSIKDQNLRLTLAFGIGIHHAGRRAGVGRIVASRQKHKKNESLTRPDFNQQCSGLFLFYSDQDPAKNVKSENMFLKIVMFFYTWIRICAPIMNPDPEGHRIRYRIQKAMEYGPGF